MAEESKLQLTQWEQDAWKDFGTGSRMVTLSEAQIKALLSLDLPPELGDLRSQLEHPVSTWDRDVLTLAKRAGRDGEIEVDESAIVSEGDDNGAYVSAWLWVPFEGTALDKDLEAEVEDAPTLSMAK
jgi:hypothetical protein